MQVVLFKIMISPWQIDIADKWRDMIVNILDLSKNTFRNDMFMDITHLDAICRWVSCCYGSDVDVMQQRR